MSISTESYWVSNPVYHHGDVCKFCGGKGKRPDPNCPPTMGYVGPNGEGCPEIHCNPCGGTGVFSIVSSPSTGVVLPGSHFHPVVSRDERFEIQPDKVTGKYLVEYYFSNNGEIQTHKKECVDLNDLMKFIASKA